MTIWTTAFPDNPVRVDHVSMHGTVLNSLAMQKYGYSADTVTPPGGVIVRKQGTNEPYGLIMETAFLPVVSVSEPMTPEQEKSHPRRPVADALCRGRESRRRMRVRRIWSRYKP